MNKKKTLYKITRIVSILFSLFILLTTTAAMAASVTLRWDPLSTSPDGYRLFARKSGQSYNFSQPAWQGTAVSCTLNNLQNQTEYYFVVRAFEGSQTSSDSNEAHYIPLPAATPNTNPTTPSSNPPAPSSNPTAPSSNPTAPSSNTPAPSGVGVADLSARFSETTLTAGVEYYTDRGYQLTGVPSLYENLDAIITPNNDRDRTDVRDYLTFTMPYDGAVYVAYDARATSRPQWMNSFVDTGDTLQTSLSSQPYLKIFARNYAQGAVINLGANKAPGFVGTGSNYIVFYGNTDYTGTTPSSNTTPSSSNPPAPSSDTPASSGGGLAALNSRFSETTLVTGVEYYTDRDYQLTGVPLLYENLDAIITPNNDRDRTDVRDYLTFTMPYDGAVYVAYDARATSRPQWMNGFTDTGDVLRTSLSSQPSLKIYRRNYANGAIVNFGANKAPGFAGTASNYIVFYGNIDSSATTPSSNTPPSSSNTAAPSPDTAAPSSDNLVAISSRFSETTLATGVEYYTDRGYQLTSVPSRYENMDAIITPNSDRDRTDVRDYLSFTMPYDGVVYVAYDGRATSLPQWMNYFIDTGDTLETSLSSQPYLKIYLQNYAQGDVVNLGANKAPGFAGTASNYIVFYSWSGR